MEKFIEEPKNPLKAEHLKEGVKPIIGAIGTPEQFEGSDGPEREAFEDPSVNQDIDNNRSLNVDYNGNPDTLNKLKFKHMGRGSYVISPIDGSDKFSRRFKNCTGLVVSGIDKETGKEISFLSHQDSDYFFDGDKKHQTFTNDLRERLEELKSKCVEGTIDAVIMGGDYIAGSYPRYREDYVESIGMLGKITKSILGFEPVVMTGPKTGPGPDHVFYDTHNRRLYIERPEVGKESTKSYLPSEVEEKRKDW